MKDTPVTIPIMCSRNCTSLGVASRSRQCTSRWYPNVVISEGIAMVAHEMIFSEGEADLNRTMDTLTIGSKRLACLRKDITLKHLKHLGV